MAEGNLKKSYTDLCISLGIEDIDNTKGSVERLIQITAYQGFDPKAIISHFINKKGSINTLVQIITILLHRGPGVYGTKTKGNTVSLNQMIKDTKNLILPKKPAQFLLVFPYQTCAISQWVPFTIYQPLAGDEEVLWTQRSQMQ
ncbi:hypothetical protein M8J77_002837 [Diaphorina citri]|nr:hypothetical protein M8J77_002837 [Diaphorina citri]